MLSKLDPRNEPISVSTLVTVITFVAARFGFDLSASDAMAISTVVFVVGQWAARALSVPVAKHDKIVEKVIDSAAGAVINNAGPH